VISNLGACAIFAALNRLLAGVLRGDRQDGHPEMRKRGYLPTRSATYRLDLRRRHARHPDSRRRSPSSLRHRHRNLDRPPVPRRRAARLDAHRSVHPVDAVRIWRRGFRAHAAGFRYSWKEKFQSIPKGDPVRSPSSPGSCTCFTGGVATPSEAAGVGAALCVVLALVILPQLCGRATGGRSCATPRASR